MTKHPDLFAALAAPFDPNEVKVRTQAGRSLHYITARTAMNRLDNVLGPENWWDDYIPGDKSVLCRLTIRLPDGAELTTCDAGGYAGMQDAGDDEKSGFSDAFKRAVVKFGVGRYLYRDGVPSFFEGEVPEPAMAAVAPAPSRAHNGHSNGNGNGYHPPAQQQNGRSVEPRIPTSGKGLFAWTKDMEQKYEVGLLKHLNEWAKLQNFPGRMVDWDSQMVHLAHDEACRKLASLTNSRQREPGDGSEEDDATPF